MDLSTYTVKDFVLHESFQKWILERDDDARTFWVDWMNEHPEKTELIKEAASIVESLSKANENILTNAGDHVWNMITASIHTLETEAIITKIREIQNTR
jgi:mevalonate kinase